MSNDPIVTTPVTNPSYPAGTVVPVNQATNDDIVNEEHNATHHDAHVGGQIGGIGGAVTGAVAGSAVGPVGTVAGAVIGAVAGAVASHAAVDQVDKIDDDTTVTGLGSHTGRTDSTR